MITTIEQINEKLAIMDKSIAAFLEDGDTKSLIPFHREQSELHRAIYGIYYGVKPIQPSFRGHLHVKEEFIYLLDSLKIIC